MIFYSLDVTLITDTEDVKAIGQIVYTFKGSKETHDDIPTEEQFIAKAKEMLDAGNYQKLPNTSIVTSTNIKNATVENITNSIYDFINNINEVTSVSSLYVVLEPIIQHVHQIIDEPDSSNIPTQS